MKLRNRKTGEIWKLCRRGEGVFDEVWLTNGYQKHKVESLTELIKCWEGVYAEYPAFEEWQKGAIQSDIWNGIAERNSFLTFAPEDFYVVENGVRKYLFTWDEAMKLEEEVLKPNGWRLPTCKEICQLCACYVSKDGDDDVKRFMKELNAEKRGYKSPTGNINDVGSYGYWWTSTAGSGADARYLYFGSGYFYPQNNNNKGYGFAVRCVAL